MKGCGELLYWTPSLFMDCFKMFAFNDVALIRNAITYY